MNSANGNTIQRLHRQLCVKSKKPAGPKVFQNLTKTENITFLYIHETRCVISQFFNLNQDSQNFINPKEISDILKKTQHITTRTFQPHIQTM